MRLSKGGQWIPRWGVGDVITTTMGVFTVTAVSTRACLYDCDVTESQYYEDHSTRMTEYCLEDLLESPDEDNQRSLPVGDARTVPVGDHHRRDQNSGGMVAVKGLSGLIGILLLVLALYWLDTGRLPW